MILKKKAKNVLSKLKFLLYLTPRLDKSNDDLKKLFIPPPYKAVVLISADFEMAWASRFTKSSMNPLEVAIKNGLTTRKNMPLILDLCDKFSIPITWATIGHLFLDRCNRNSQRVHPELPRIPYFENQFWKFDKGDWFDYDPCTDYQSDTAWYAPDLIKDIQSRKVKHEIGCHTFSHIDCSDRLCPNEVFKNEISTCQQLAHRFGISLSSFVHPGHQIGHLNSLAEMGFTSYRTDFGDTLAYPNQHSSGLWELKNTSELTWRDGWSLNYQIKRYKTIINRAIKHQKLCVLWFHPSLPTAFVNIVLPEILEHLDKCRSEVAILTHSQYIEYLESKFLKM